MTVGIRPTPPRPSPASLPPLEAGDHLDQKTFHERYEVMPSHIRAELLGGVVYLTSRVKADHGRLHADMMGWLGLYRAATPGVGVTNNTTNILGDDSET